MHDERTLVAKPLLAVADGAAKGPSSFFHVGPLVLIPIMVVTVQRACEFSQAWGRCWYSTTLTGGACHSQGTGTGSSCLAFACSSCTSCPRRSQDCCFCSP
jgi:hypothetical protein